MSAVFKDSWAWQNKRTPVISGGIGDDLVKARCRQMSPPVLTYSPDTGCDQGVDFMSLSKGGGVLKVQVVSGCPHGPAGFVINKPCEAILELIDIVAVYINFDGSDSKDQAVKNHHSQDHFFILPRCVYGDERMYKYYHNTETSWNVNLNKKLKKPLDVAYNAFHLFDYTAEQHQDQLEIFFD